MSAFADVRRAHKDRRAEAMRLCDLRLAEAAEQYQGSILLICKQYASDMVQATRLMDAAQRYPEELSV